MPGIEIRGRSKIANYRHGGRAGLQKGGRGSVTEEGFPMPEGHAASVQRRGQLIEKGAGEPLPRGKGKWRYQKGGRVGLKAGGNGKWIQKATASIKRRGTKGKCTPITKPGCTGRAKALAKTFKKMARERKAS